MCSSVTVFLKLYIVSCCERQGMGLYWSSSRLGRAFSHSWVLHVVVSQVMRTSLGIWQISTQTELTVLSVTLLVQNHENCPVGYWDPCRRYLAWAIPSWESILINSKVRIGIAIPLFFPLFLVVGIKNSDTGDSSKEVILQLWTKHMPTLKSDHTSSGLWLIFVFAGFFFVFFA